MIIFFPAREKIEFIVSMTQLIDNLVMQLHCLNMSPTIRSSKRLTLDDLPPRAKLKIIGYVYPYELVLGAVFPTFCRAFELIHRPANTISHAMYKALSRNVTAKGCVWVILRQLHIHVKEIASGQVNIPVVSNSIGGLFDELVLLGDVEAVEMAKTFILNGKINIIAGNTHLHWGNVPAFKIYMDAYWGKHRVFEDACYQIETDASPEVIRDAMSPEIFYKYFLATQSTFVYHLLSRKQRVSAFDDLRLRGLRTNKPPLTPALAILFYADNITDEIPSERPKTDNLDYDAFARIKDISAHIRVSKLYFREARVYYCNQISLKLFGIDILATHDQFQITADDVFKFIYHNEKFELDFDRAKPMLTYPYLLDNNIIIHYDKFLKLWPKASLKLIARCCKDHPKEILIKIWRECSAGPDEYEFTIVVKLAREYINKHGCVEDFII